MSDKLQEVKDELGYCIEQADEPEAQPLKRILALLLAVEQEQVCDYQYAKSLFALLAPQCQPLPSLGGILTQIDNWCSGRIERTCPVCKGEAKVDDPELLKDKNLQRQDCWKPCPACDGKGDYRSWAEKQIEELNIRLKRYDDNMLYLVERNQEFYDMAFADGDTTSENLIEVHRKLKQQITDLTEQKNTLEQAFDQAAKTVAGQLKTIANLQAKNEGMKETIKNERVENVDCRQVLIGKINDLQAKLGENKKRIAHLEKQNELLVIDRTALRIKLETPAPDVRVLSRQIIDLQAERDAAVEALKATSASLPERSLMKEKIEVALDKINSEKKEGGK